LKPMTEEEAEGCPEAQWDFENMWKHQYVNTSYVENINWGIEY
jgi:hypothetical protein